MTDKNSLQEALKSKLVGMIQEGQVIPTPPGVEDKPTAAKGNYTRFVATVRNREVLLLCNEKGQLYFPKTGELFTMK